MTNNQVEQVVVGSILGDGTIGKRGNYQEGHCLKQEDYLLWKKKILDKKFKESSLSYYYGKRNSCHLYVPKQSFFQEYREISYPNGKKIITNKFLDKIGKLAIVVWYFDDGCYIPETNTVMIFSLGFSYKENEKLQKMLKDRFGLNFKIRYLKIQDHYFLACSGENTDKFLAFIKGNAPFIPKSMTYKLGKFHKGNLKWIEERIKKNSKRNKKYYIKNKKQINQRNNNYHWKNRKRLLKNRHDYYQNNKDKFEEYRRIHKDEIRQWNIKYRERNRKKLNDYAKKYYLKMKRLKENKEVSPNGNLRKLLSVNN